MSFRIETVSALPGTLVASTIYFVRASAGDDSAETWITDSSGTNAYEVGNTTMIDRRVTAGAGNQLQIVADIAARDAAFTGSNNLLALVLDASADATVSSGAAFYAYDGTSTYKVSEFESLDVSSIAWSSITGGPSSTPTQIDDAVTDSHTHANKTQLDLIGETSGTPTYNGIALVRGASAW